MQGKPKQCVSAVHYRDARVAAAMKAVQLQAGDASLHVARHFSLRDVVKWARRMQVGHSAIVFATDWWGAAGKRLSFACAS